MAAHTPAQLVISHGSAAGIDSRTDAPSDTMTVLPHSKVARHGERDVSITPADLSVERTGATQTAVDILDAALSEDSLGLTPPMKPSSRRDRAASGPRSRRDLMPMRAVLRSSSGARKTRGPDRAASPAIMEQLGVLQASAPPADASIEARLAALEASSAAGFAYMQEAGPAIQNLQVAMFQTNARVEELGGEISRQALEQAELVKATRREVFAVRDLLGEKVQASEVNLKAGTVAVVDA